MVGKERGQGYEETLGDQRLGKWWEMGGGKVFFGSD